MVFPFIPLIVAGVVAASTGLAGKKGYDSYQNMQETKELAQSLESKYKRAFKKFEIGRDYTNNRFEKYGLLKLNILDDSMKEFVATFKQIKNMDFKGEAVTDQFLSDKEIERFVLDVEKQVINAGQVMKAGIASLAGGGLAAMGALGATTSFAAASTGTAIASLSGIAAKNATLAFLGGGALGAGGLGMSVGTLVLGGIAIAPTLAISSLIFASSTEKKLEDMYVQRAVVYTEVEKLKSATNVMTQISSTTEAMHDLADSTNKMFLVTINKMKKIINKNGKDFGKYSQEEKEIIYNNYKVAIIMRDILNTTILNDKGELMPNIQSIIKAEQLKVSALKVY